MILYNGFRCIPKYIEIYCIVTIKPSLHKAGINMYFSFIGAKHKRMVYVRFTIMYPLY